MVDMLQVRTQMSTFDNFKAFVQERINMKDRDYVSADDYLATYHFPNIHRDDDAVTQWLRTFYYQPNLTNPNAWMAPVFGRFFNHPAILNQIGLPAATDTTELYAEWSKRVQYIAAVINAGFSVFNSHTAQRALAGRQVSNVLVSICSVLIENRQRFKAYIDGSKALEPIQGMYQLMPGIGLLTSGEIALDYLYMPGTIEMALDATSFVADTAALRGGLNLLHLRYTEMAVPWPLLKPELRNIAQQLEKAGMPLPLFAVARAISLYYHYYTLIINRAPNYPKYKPGATVNLAVPFSFKG